MNIYSLSFFNDVSFFSDFLFISIKDVLLLFKPLTFSPFFNPLVIAPIKKNPINNHISLSRNINDEKACPDLTISVRGSRGSKLLNYMYI